MIPALLIGRAGSTGVPVKNLRPILGRPLMLYPILAAQHSRYVDRDHIYLSTDSGEMQDLGRRYGCRIIERPAALATKEALAEDAFAHGFSTIQQAAPKEIQMVVLLFCNSATIPPGIIDRGVETLRSDPSLDSAVTVSRYNMWSPLRAKRINEQGLLVPFVSPDLFADASCDRDSQGDTYYADCSAFVVRPRCFDYERYGELPFRWMGRRVYPLEQWGGLDVDAEWQFPTVEFWLRQHGFSEQATPYDSPA